MKLITPEQMRRIDQEAILRVGIPGIILMENAAFQVAMKASEILSIKGGSHVLVVAGSGNNGGDAYAASRHLLSMGYSVSLFSLNPLEALKGDAKVFASILDNMGFVMISLDTKEAMERFKAACQSSDLVIDGLFGTGLNRDISGLSLEAIKIINQFSKTTLSIDIPSGVDGLCGRILGSCVKADYTVTFFLPKTGMVQYPAAAALGELTVADIGIPYPLADGLGVCELTDQRIVAAILPKRPENSHKGTFGKILILAGSYAMPGAAAFSALSAYRTGSGLVRLAVPHSLVPGLGTLVPEAVFAPLDECEGHFAKIDNSVLETLLTSCDAVLIGPGLSISLETRELVKQVILLCRKPLVLDADALNIIAEDPDILSFIQCETVITPHPAEMARLTGSTIEKIQDNRMETAKEFAQKYGLTVVLKGAGTIIAGKDDRVAVNPTGNHGMATAGSGDVLAGMVVSLLGQRIPAFEAAVAGAWLHGTAGDLAAREKGHAGMTASDLSEYIGKALRPFESEN